MTNNKNNYLRPYFINLMEKNTRFDQAAPEQPNKSGLQIVNKMKLLAAEQRGINW